MGGIGRKGQIVRRKLDAARRCVLPRATDSRGGLGCDWEAGEVTFGMISKAVCLLILCVGCSALAATNEYYTKAEVKGIIDEMIKAYGGVEKLKGMERAKISMDVKE